MPLARKKEAKQSDETGENAKTARAVEIPENIKERCVRAKDSIRQGVTKRNECLAFWRGDQYVHRNTDGYLVKQGTVVGEKPSHRPRTTRNLIHGLVEGKVSAATQRIPAYEVSPSTTDPEDISAARMSEKVALYGFNKWCIRRASKKVITSALVMDGGYAMPYWDSSIGPYLEEAVGVGDVRVRTFTGNEVGWEPGVPFEDSPYHIICQARTIPEIKAMPGYLPGELTPDASHHEILNSGARRYANSKLVMVTEYMERPCAKYPKGRRIVTANDRIILPEEPYPCAAYGYDGICLHPLTYTIDPDDDRDRGMVVHMLDAQRTYNNCTNQQIAWAQLALNPQIIGPPMANKIKFTDEPGAYYTVVPINGMTPQWRDVPPIPPELSGMKLEAKADLYEIAAADEIPEDVESAKGIQIALEKSRARWASFLQDVADFHGSLMRHCLSIVQYHYTEPRLVSIRGRFGWENIDDFIGADLCDQIDVRVNPGSIEPRTRAAVESRVQWLVQAFPGYVKPEAAMAALEGGAGDKLIEGYELDVARANLMIQKIVAGPEVLFSEPLVDPLQPPSWAPRKFDNTGVHMQIFADYMKTPDFDAQPDEVKEALRLYYEGCEFLDQQRQIMMAMQQQQMAMDVGMANASGGPQPKPMPSLPTPAA